MKRLSVIICTYNRSATLAKALTTVLACPVPRGWQMECVVVDNASTDRTRAVVTALAAQAPAGRLRYIYEATPGLSRARNAGVRAAQGELLAFTDDDCRVSPTWLEELVAAFERAPQMNGLFGQVQSFKGISSEYAVAIKSQEEPRTFQFPCSPLTIGHGNNMAFRRIALEAVGEFDVALGAGGPLRSAEDLDIAYRLLRWGNTLIYNPRCVVEHRPRTSIEEVHQAHWRNAIGLGAFLGKHILHGDLLALKLLYWFVIDLPAASHRARRRGRPQEAGIPWIYVMGVPWGILKRLRYEVSNRLWYRHAKGDAVCRA